MQASLVHDRLKHDDATMLTILMACVLRYPVPFAHFSCGYSGFFAFYIAIILAVWRKHRKLDRVSVRCLVRMFFTLVLLFSSCSLYAVYGYFIVLKNEWLSQHIFWQTLLVMGFPITKSLSKAAMKVSVARAQVRCCEKANC